MVLRTILTYIHPHIGNKAQLSINHMIFLKYIITKIFDLVEKPLGFSLKQLFHTFIASLLMTCNRL